MTDDIVTVWTKPGCTQCRFVKYRLDAADVPYRELDLSSPDHAKDLAHFAGIGYRQAPITEYGDIAFPGFMPSNVDRIIARWRELHPEVQA